MKKSNIFQKIWDSGKLGKGLIYTVLFASILVGFILWFISRPLVALAHLLMLHPRTAWKEFIEVDPEYLVEDL